MNACDQPGIDRKRYSNRETLWKMCTLNPVRCYKHKFLLGVTYLIFIILAIFIYFISDRNFTNLIHKIIIYTYVFSYFKVQF